jgi:predicted nuclease of restriction endonuclease-like RecB superfamily
MHMSVEKPESAKDRKEYAELAELVSAVFKEAKPMKYGDLQTAIMEATHQSKKTAERKIARMAELKIITKNTTGLYEKAP